MDDYLTIIGAIALVGLLNYTAAYADGTRGILVLYLGIALGATIFCLWEWINE